MPHSRQLIRRKITYSEANTSEFNILHKLGYLNQQLDFFLHINDKREWIKTVVAHHLGLKSSSDCHVADISDWVYGSFNVGIPITINSWHGKRILMRFPMPHRVGENFRPGNLDEKIQCEAGSYVWLQESCPDVPIPELYGFALSTGETFTRLEYLPLFHRWFQVLRQRFLSWLGKPTPSKYVRHQNADLNTTDRDGYILIEFIEETRGGMLSMTWEEGRRNPKLRTNLFRDLSQIFLSISRVPVPRIGSFIIDVDGYLRLANRPLSVEMELFENEEIPTDMSRDWTYSTTDSYLVDILGFHDNRFRHQPNAVKSTGDCAYQLSVLSGMRTVFQAIFNRAFRRGPFVFSFTDLHQSNIFVDAEWHITCLVDLEWACTRPIEMFQPPHWFTDKSVDEMDSAEYDEIRQEFMGSLRKEEEGLLSATPTVTVAGSQLRLSEIMEQSWETGAFWYSLALSSPSGIFWVFTKHIQPRFFEDLERDVREEYELVMPFLFDQKATRIAARKLDDKKEYDEKLRRAFADNSD